MKSFRLLFIAGIAFAPILTSCTMEKRVHMSGYHIDWHKGKNSSVLKSSDNHNKISNENKAGLTEQSNLLNNTDDNYSNPNISNEEITASADNGQNIIQRKEKSNVLSRYKINSAGDEQVKPSFKSELKKGTKMIMSHAEEPRNNGMALAGFISSLAGLLIFGFILGTLAVIFSAIGLSKIKKDPSKWKGRGMAIAGLVIGVIDIIAWILILAVLL